MFDRDFRGKKGQIRIWCPAEEFREKALGREERQGFRLSTKEIKKPGQKHVDEFREALGKQGFSSILSDVWNCRGTKSCTSWMQRNLECRDLCNLECCCWCCVVVILLCCYLLNFVAFPTWF